MTQEEITSLQILIVDDSADLDRCRFDGTQIFPVNECGRELSTSQKIKPNSVDDGYCVLYHITEFTSTDKRLFVQTISSMFADNLPDSFIDVSIDINGNPLDARFFVETIELKKAFDEINPKNMEVVHLLHDQPDESEAEDDDEDEDDDSDYDDTDDDTDENEDDDDSDFESKLIHDVMDSRWDGSFQGFAMHGLELESECDRCPRSKGRDWQRSYCMRNSKNMKRNFKRHNIIIVSKRDYKRDKKTLNSILRWWLSNKEGFHSRYREEVLERWMAAFAITEKQAERLREQHKKAERSKSIKRKANKVKSIARVVGSSYSAFYDPNKS